MDITKAVQIREKYEQYSKGYEHLIDKGTGIGIFSRSKATNAYRGLQLLIEHEFINPEKPFLDAGCGDALVVELALELQLDAYGVEYHKELALVSFSNLKRKNAHLNEKGIPRIKAGDFTKSDTYHDWGMNFQDFQTIYNFRNNHRDIAKKIANESKPGTIFVLYCGNTYEEFSGLELIAKIDGPVLNNRITSNPITKPEHIDDYQVPETSMLIFKKS